MSGSSLVNYGKFNSKMQYFNPNDKNLTRDEAIANIHHLEEALLSQENCVYLDDLEYKHWFAPGLYGREITIPGNMVLTTMIHASEHIAILAKGSFTVYTEKGLEYYKAPFTMITKVGTKRAMITHEEVVFITIHHNPDNETDIDKLVSMMTFKNELEYQRYEEGLLEVMS